MRITKEDLRESIDKFNEQFNTNYILTGFGGGYNLHDTSRGKMNSKINGVHYLTIKEMWIFLDGLWKGQK